MPRYRLDLAYNGTDYSGWQIQPNAPTVQATIEQAMSVWFREPIAVVGCGRTDAGVHASKYVLHFDHENKGIGSDDLYHLNQILPSSIALHSIDMVAEDFHARFDAKQRGYTYFLSTKKDPFKEDVSFYYPRIQIQQLDLLNQAAAMLLQYDDFSTFCKTGSDVEHKLCKLTTAYWKSSHDGLEFHITGNRFLRGMVRLIVGMCLRVAEGKITLQDLAEAMETQAPLNHAWSVPAKGLFLAEVSYNTSDFN